MILSPSMRSWPWDSASRAVAVRRAAISPMVPSDLQGRRLVVQLLAHLLADDRPRPPAALAQPFGLGQLVDAAVAGQVPGQLLPAVPLATGLRRIAQVHRGLRGHGLTCGGLGEEQELVGVEALGARAVQP